MNPSGSDSPEPPSNLSGVSPSGKGDASGWVITPTPENDTTKSSVRKSFAFRLGVAIKQHVRWWHICISLAASAFVAGQYGIANCLALLAIVAILVSVVVYVAWVMDDSNRARGAIFFLLMMLFGAVAGVGRVAIKRLNPAPTSQITPNIQFPKDFNTVPQRVPAFGTLNSAQKQQATLRYWQSAVANLHAVRFETPSGQEPAEKYYLRMFQQLRRLTDAARMASTINVDPDLVTMATRHLVVEERVLLLKQKVDEFMQREKLPSPTDTVDQRMAITEFLLGTLQAHPGALPPGPERDFLEKGLDLEQQRLEQFREIEIMQAVLQERYKGVAFPLPAIEP